jgi:hypothetical protein
MHSLIHEGISKFVIVDNGSNCTMYTFSNFVEYLDLIKEHFGVEVEYIRVTGKTLWEYRAIAYNAVKTEKILIIDDDMFAMPKAVSALDSALLDQGFVSATVSQEGGIGLKNRDFSETFDIGLIATGFYKEDLIIEGIKIVGPPILTFAKYLQSKDFSDFMSDIKKRITDAGFDLSKVGGEDSAVSFFLATYCGKRDGSVVTGSRFIHNGAKSPYMKWYDGGDILPFIFKTYPENNRRK